MTDDATANTLSDSITKLINTVAVENESSAPLKQRATIVPIFAACPAYRSLITN